jgi:hypothetical protein
MGGYNSGRHGARPAIDRGRILDNDSENYYKLISFSTLLRKYFRHGFMFHNVAL